MTWQLMQANGKKRRLHLTGQDRAQTRTRSFITQDSDQIFAVVGRGKSRSWSLRNRRYESIDRVAQNFPCNRLQQKFVRPRFQRARAIDRIITSRHHDNLRRLELLPNGAANLEAIRLWH